MMDSEGCNGIGDPMAPDVSLKRARVPQSRLLAFSCVDMYYIKNSKVVFLLPVYVVLNFTPCLFITATCM